VKAKTGYSDTQRWRLEKAGKFPQRVQLTENGAVGSYEDEIDEWIRSRVRQGGKRPSVQWRGGARRREPMLGSDPAAD
jgi:predicted DNA-binding transcriptional regulator AlpA